ncbi:MAG TPA: glyoxalase [Tepidanaerobacter syntrophicus]|uniref:VOC family protein n=1 Tax=Tepidanaerobacter syntrophicus TaxID=224999 RepID=UPI0017758501|nr:VOC family protein [Tepidanaerobacter syntrophicus]HHV83791.1 glyoxalase [Tepidanaerobacter syntrophicus]
MQKPIFKNLLQVGIVVDDLDKYLKKYYDEYGIGPWIILDFNKDTVKNMTIKGKRVDYAMRLATCDFNGVQWELIQPLDDKCVYYDFLKTHGPGIHHVALGIDNYDDVVKFLADKGIYELQGGNYMGLQYTYFDLTDDLALIGEIYNGEVVMPEDAPTYPPKS